MFRYFKYAVRGVSDELSVVGRVRAPLKHTNFYKNVFSDFQDTLSLSNAAIDVCFTVKYGTIIMTISIKAACSTIHIT